MPSPQLGQGKAVLFCSVNGRPEAVQTSTFLLILTTSGRPPNGCPLLWLLNGRRRRYGHSRVEHGQPTMTSRADNQFTMAAPAPSVLDTHDVPGAHLIDLITPQNQPDDTGLITRASGRYRTVVVGT